MNEKVLLTLRFQAVNSFSLQLMIEKENAMDIPMPKRMVRQATLREEHQEEHKAALERAFSLNVAQTMSYGTFESNERDWEKNENEDVSEISDLDGERCEVEGSTKSKWDKLRNIFVKDKSGRKSWNRRPGIV